MSPQASEPLAVFLAGELAGTISRDRRGLRLDYDPHYAARSNAVPLSLSLPMSDAAHTGERVSGWLDGLLPANENIRRRWASRHSARSHGPFDLLSTPVGLDCAGAVQTCPQSQTDTFGERPGGVDWLATETFAALIDQLVRDQIWQRPAGRSAWSLAGAQSKTTLVSDGDKWGEPWGGTPSTQILKPSMSDMPGQALNEHLCLTAARHCGIAAAVSDPLRVGDHLVVAVHRYDRVNGADGAVQRVHQEDFHQACGEPAVNIYQIDGEGHSVTRLARLIADHSADPRADRQRFFDALAFNWLICNVDGHTKNYSLLLAPGGARLAPLYDLWSRQPYDPDYISSYTMAMSALPDATIGAAHNPEAWQTTARAVGLAPGDGPERVAHLAALLPDAFTAAADQLSADLRGEPVVASLTADMAARAASCADALTRPHPNRSREAPRL